MKCKKCGREIETDNSISRGHGSTCYIAMLERENALLKQNNALLKALLAALQRKGACKGD